MIIQPERLNHISPRDTSDFFNSLLDSEVTAPRFPLSGLPCGRGGSPERNPCGSFPARTGGRAWSSWLGRLFCMRWTRSSNCLKPLHGP